MLRQFAQAVEVCNKPEDVVTALQRLIEKTPDSQNSSRDERIVAEFEGVSFTEANFAETIIYKGQRLKRHRNGGGWVPADQDEHDTTKAFVAETAYVGPFAMVFGNARVYGNARVSGGACIFGNAQVYDNARVYADAQVYDNAEVSGNARVSGNAKVSGNAQVSERVVLTQGIFAEGKHTA